MKITEGRLIGTGLNIGIVGSRANELVTSRLIDGAKNTLLRHDVSASAIDIFYVPGVWELPLVAQELALTGKYDAIIALGAVILGDTPHSGCAAAEVSRGLAGVSLNHRVPVLFGVLTCDTLEQALSHAGGNAGNKGADCAVGAVETANLLHNIRKQNNSEERSTINA